jgi:hypothetical protein
VHLLPGIGVSLHYAPIKNMNASLDHRIIKYGPLVNQNKCEYKTTL